MFKQQKQCNFVIVQITSAPNDTLCIPCFFNGVVSSAKEYLKDSRDVS